MGNRGVDGLVVLRGQGGSGGHMVGRLLLARARVEENNGGGKTLLSRNF